MTEIARGQSYVISKAREKTVLRQPSLIGARPELKQQTLVVYEPDRKNI
jgi:hypothetical protein